MVRLFEPDLSKDHRVYRASEGHKEAQVSQDAMATPCCMALERLSSVMA